MISLRSWTPFKGSGNQRAALQGTMRRPYLVGVVMWSLCVIGCKPGPHRIANEQAEPQDKTSPAFKAGEAAHEIVTGAEKAAKAAGRKIDESARKAREGWKEKAREDRKRDPRVEDRP
jgi:hypothetical protein